MPRIIWQEMRFLAVTELWALADAIAAATFALVVLGGYGRLRIGEMLALRSTEDEAASAG